MKIDLILSIGLERFAEIHDSSSHGWVGDMGWFHLDDPIDQIFGNRGHRNYKNASNEWACE